MSKSEPNLTGQPTEPKKSNINSCNSEDFFFSPYCPDVARQFGYLPAALAPDTLLPPVFAWQHYSTAPISNNIVVILCYPTGYEYTHSHRSFQHLADQLAAIGCLVIRFDYSSTGDSAGTELPDNLIPIWLENISSIANQVRKTIPDCQLCLAGLRLGATLAHLAAQTLTPNYLILWEPIVKGKRYLRELQALSKFGVDAENQDDEFTEFAGFLMSKATAEGLKNIDLMKVPLAAETRVLCIYREDANREEPFIDWLRTQTIYLTTEYQPGYEDMLEVPHKTQVPFQAIGVTTKWLADSELCQNNQSSVKPLGMLENITFENAIQEQGIWYDDQGDKKSNKIVQHKLFAILTQPKHLDPNRPVVILLNSGAVHHVGPNRVYTQIARTIAETGLRCVRLDIEGLGDSFKPDKAKENHPFQPNTQSNLDGAISYFKNRGLAQEFIIGGICSGAHAAFHGALQISSPAIREIMLINPLVFYWEDSMSLDIPGDIQIAQDSKYYSNSVRDPKKWMKIFTGKASTSYIFAFLKKQIIKQSRELISGIRELLLKENSALSVDLVQITQANIPIDLLVSASDPGLELVKSQAKYTFIKACKAGAIRVKIFAGANHTFSRLRHRQDLLDYLKNKFSNS